MELQKHSLKCSVDNCEGGRPVSFKEQQEDKEDYETQDEKDEVYTDVVELEESEDSEDAQVIDLVEVQVDKVSLVPIDAGIHAQLDQFYLVFE